MNHKPTNLLMCGVLAGLILSAAACGSDESDEQAVATTTPESVATGDDTGTDPLVREWVTVNDCEQFVDVLTEAGLAEFAAEMAPGVSDSPPGKPDPDKPCEGAKPAEHSHSFSEDGQFASYDDNGREVDHGTYEITDDGVFVLSRPPFESEVRYEVNGDTATFELVLPKCEDEGCRTGAALGIATFFPRTYERVDDGPAAADTPTKAEFIAQADEICAAGDRQIDADASAILGAESRDSQPSPKQVAKIVDKAIAPGVQGQVDQIRALTRPAGDEEVVGEFLDSAEAGVEALRDDPSRLVTDDDPFAETSRLASAYGFEVCGG